MSQPFQPNLDFTAAVSAAEDGEALIVDLEGYEGDPPGDPANYRNDDSRLRSTRGRNPRSVRD